jgi:hypothetical protein
MNANCPPLRSNAKAVPTPTRPKPAEKYGLSASEASKLLSGIFKTNYGFF